MSLHKHTEQTILCDVCFNHDTIHFISFESILVEFTGLREKIDPFLLVLVWNLIANWQIVIHNGEVRQTSMLMVEF